MDDLNSLTVAVKIMLFVVLASFGTLARELRLSQRGLVLARLVSNIVVSIFGALICYFIFDMTDMPSQIGYITAGLVGFGGPQVIDSLFKKAVPDASDYDTTRKNTHQQKQLIDNE